MGLDNNIPEGWIETTIGKVTVVESGGTPSTKNSSYWGDEIPWITPRDLSSFKDVFIEKGERSISIEGLDNSSAKLLPKNTILFSSRAPIGYVVIAQNETATNQGFKNLICDEVNSHYKYFYYLMKYKSDYIERLSSGSTFSEASGTLIKSIELLLPPLPEQKAIANVLTAFDDKIELLQAQNKTSESMAQTIFKEWFGKYQIGDDLPEGWKEDSLDNIALEITRGFTTSYVEKSDIINLNQKVNKGKKLDKQHFKYYPNDTIVPNNKFIKKYDILLNSLGQGTLGRVHLYKENTENVVADQHVSILRFNNDLSYYVYQILASKSGQYRLENEITGSTGMLMLNIGRVRDFKIIVPTKEKLELFKKSLDPIYGKVEINNSQIQSLTKTRDTLLPKLMSGQVRVSNIKNA